MKNADKQKTNGANRWFFNVFVVKVMGIEPMSESTSAGASPSAACVLRFRFG